MDDPMDGGYNGHGGFGGRGGFVFSYVIYNLFLDLIEEDFKDGECHQDVGFHQDVDNTKDMASSHQGNRKDMVVLLKIRTPA